MNLVSCNYILMIHMRKELYLPESPLCIDTIVKRIANLFYCDLLFRLGIGCAAAEIENRNENQHYLIKKNSKCLI